MEGPSVLERVQQAAEAGDWAAVAQVLDLAELEEPGAQATLQWPHALHLLCLVYVSRLEDARFMYKRIPDEIKQRAPELPAAWEVLQRLWVRDYAGVWAVLGGAWSPALQPVAAAVAEQRRQHMLRLVGRAYASLSPAKLAALLGASEQEAIQAAADQGWELDGGSGVVVVKQREGGEGAHATPDHLKRLSEYIVHLEG